MLISVLPDQTESYMEQERLAVQVMSWWHERGFTNVFAKATEARTFIGKGGYAPMFYVSSNLVNGLPPGTNGRSVVSAVRRAMVRRHG